MAEPAKGKSAASLDEGLVDFHSSQAKIVLAQYRNIEQLLGKTDDWLWPGTHCEVLIRDFIRRNVHASMRVDKGYVFGRTKRRGEDKHCPEIDILIHNADKSPPVFRLEDFVIVQASATLSMIQVKRTLNHVICRKGIKNVMEAKLHTIKMLCGNRPFVSMNDLGGHQIHSAVVSIEDKFGDDPRQFSETIKRLLSDGSRLYPPLPVRKRDPFGVSLLPDFVGSLSGHFAMRLLHCSEQSPVYLVMKSEQKGKNVALQALLLSLAKCFPMGRGRPVFQFPEMEQLGFAVEQRITILDDRVPTDE
jgi:hypothetical protein